MIIFFCNFSLNEREFTKIRAFHCERRSDKINRMEMCAEGVRKTKALLKGILLLLDPCVSQKERIRPDWGRNQKN